MSCPPLEGVRVLDLSRIVSGPYCTQQMADLGADVIKVEPPAGDDTRRFGPPFVGDVATYFLSINRGKRSIVVDLKCAEGRQVVHDLALWADVVVENFRPGVAERLHVDAATLRGLKPGLIYASISGYGRRGSDAHWGLAGYDLVIQGQGGIPSLTGPVDGPPFKIGSSLADVIAGLNAFGAINAALFRRERTGEGETLDLSMFDGQLSALIYHATGWLNARAMPERHGNAHASICPYETFAASDGYLNIACGNDVHFTALCSVVGLDALVDDPRFGSNPSRVGNRDELLAILEPLIRSRSVEEWIGLLENVGVPCGSIASVPDALAHPQAEARGMIVENEHPVMGTVRTVASALGYEQTSYATRGPPLLGEHGLEVLRTVLVYDQERVAKLVDCGAVLNVKVV